MRLIADKAHANDTAAVALMLDLGFDALVPGPDDFEAIRWAAFHGNPEMTRALLRHDPPINVPDRSYGGTPLDNCLYGAFHGWSCDSAAMRLPGDGAAADRGRRADAARVPADRSGRCGRGASRTPRETTYVGIIVPST